MSSLPLSTSLSPFDGLFGGKLGDGSWWKTQQTFGWWNKCSQSCLSLSHTLTHTHAHLTMKAEQILSNSFVRSSSVRHWRWTKRRKRKREEIIRNGKQHQKISREGKLSHQIVQLDQSKIIGNFSPVIKSYSISGRYGTLSENIFKKNHRIFNCNKKIFSDWKSTQDYFSAVCSRG